MEKTYYSNTLYDLTEAQLKLESLITELETSEGGDPESAAIVATLYDALIQTDSDFTTKVDGYAKIIAHKSALAESRKAEAARLAASAASLDSTVNYMKQALMSAMGLLGVKKVETDTHTVSVVGNGGATPVIWSPDLTPDMLPAPFYREETKVELKYEKALIDQVIKSETYEEYLETISEDLAPKVSESDWLEVRKYVQLGERGTHLRIK
jgi:hypothetical protein